MFTVLNCFTPCVSHNSIINLITMLIIITTDKHTNLEVLAEGFGAHGTLHVSAGALAAARQRPLWQCVAGGVVPVVAEQLVLAAELQVTHVAAEQLQPNMGEGVSQPSSSVQERGPAQSALAEPRQVGLGVSSDGVGVCWQQH